MAQPAPRSEQALAVVLTVMMVLSVIPAQVVGVGAGVAAGSTGSDAPGPGAETVDSTTNAETSNPAANRTTPSTSDQGNTGSVPWYYYFRGVNTANGNLFTAGTDIEIGALGGDIAFERSYNSHLSAEHGPLGFGWTHNYAVSLETGSNGSVVLLGSDGARHVFTETADGYRAPPGVHMQLERNGSWYRLRRTDGSELSFDASGTLQRITNRNGDSVHLEYTDGQLTRIRDDSGQHLRLRYTDTGRISNITDQLGRSVQYRYETGDLAAVVGVAGNVTRYDYYENHKLRRVDSTANITRSYAYHDDTGRVRCVALGPGCLGFSDGGSVYRYDLANDTVTVRDRLSGDRQTITLDDAGSPLDVSTTTGSIEFGWDEDRNNVRITNGTGTYTFEYDEYGNLVERVAPGGRTVSFGWQVIDTEDRYIALRTSRTGPDGRTTRYRYDEDGNRVETIRPNGEVRRTRYDEHGQPIAETDFTGATTRYTYDSHGFRTSVINPVGSVTNFSYDAIGRRVSRTGPRGGTYRYELDAEGRVVEVTNPNGGTVSYDYSDGVLQSVTNPKGRTIPAGSRFETPQELNVSVNSTASVYRTDDYRYTRTFDERGRLASVVLDYGPFTRRVDYTYRDGRLATVEAPGGTTSYSYGPNGNIVRIAGPDGTGVSYSYDAEGRRTRARYDNGIETNYTYNGAGWLTDLRAVGENGTVLFDYSYTYDAAGNRISATDAGGNVTRYEYDALDRLVEVTYPSGRTVSYAYDAVGNRVERSVNGTGTSWTYSDEDELLSAGPRTYDYDAEGNLVERIGDKGTTAYEYGFGGRLTGVVRPDGTEVDYTYLPSGQRISKTTPDGTTYYLYSDADVVAAFDGTGDLERRYVPGARTDEMVSLIDGARTYYYHRDGSLNVRFLTGANGSVANRYRYTPFGQLRERSETVDNPYRFAGRRHDPRTGLYYNRHRYYDPEVGRFTRRDPAGVNVSLNAYAYGGNNPINFVDPTGLDKWTGPTAGGGVSGGAGLGGGFGCERSKLTNQRSGQTCTVTSCSIQGGLFGGGDVGGSVGGKVKRGPDCGEGLGGPTCGIGVEASAGGLSTSAGTDIGASGVSGEASAGGGAGAGLEGAAFAECTYASADCEKPECNSKCADGSGECKPCEGEECDGPGPGGDHPDDNHDLSVLSYTQEHSRAEQLPEFDYTGGRVAVLGRGFATEMGDFLVSIDESPAWVNVFTSQERLNQYDVLVIPTGGLAEVSELRPLREKLRNYVDQGGTLVVLTQQRGSDFRAVPGELRGYGWRQDQSCQFSSVGITEYCSVLASQPDNVADINVDGYFTEYPDRAEILLSRTKNGEPAMLTYDYGEGEVIASTVYVEWADGHQAGTSDGRRLLRDTLKFARRSGNVTTYGPGERIDLSVGAQSHVDMRADRTVVRLISPQGTERRIMVSGTEPLENRTVRLDATLSQDAPLGIWDVEYSLYNDSHGEIQRVRKPGQFAVARFQDGDDGWTYQGDNVTLSVTSDAERYPKGANATFRFTVRNDGPTAENVTVWWSYPHHARRNESDGSDPTYGLRGTNPGGESALSRTLRVPANGERTFTHRIPVRVSSFDRLWAQLYRGENSSSDLIGEASRAFFAFEPSIGLDVGTDRSTYGPGNPVTVNLRVRGNSSLTPAVDLRVLDPEGRSVSRDRVRVLPGANGTATRSLEFQLPVRARGGHYTVVADARRDGERIGYTTSQFTVPSSLPSVEPPLPEAVRNGSRVNFTVHNLGEGDLSNATLSAALVNPAGEEVWNDSAPIEVGARNESQVPFRLQTGPLQLGTYRLRYSLARPNESRASAVLGLPSTLTADVALDRTTYAVGQTANATVTLRNDGRFPVRQPVSIEIPEIGPEATETREIRLSPGESTTIEYGVELPEDLSGGSYGTVSFGTTNTVSESLGLFIRPSELALSTPSSAAAGDTVEVDLENRGGARTTADCSARLYAPQDAPGFRVVDEESTRTEIGAGESTAIPVDLPGQAVAGRYFVSATCVNEERGATTELLEPLDVSGLNASVASTTDTEVYTTGEAVTITTEIENFDGRIEDGTLRVRVVNASAGATGSSTSSFDGGGSVQSVSDVGATRLSTSDTDRPVASDARAVTDVGTVRPSASGIVATVSEEFGSLRAGLAFDRLAAAGAGSGVGRSAVDRRSSVSTAERDTAVRSPESRALSRGERVERESLAVSTTATGIDNETIWRGRTITKGEDVVVNASGNLTLVDTTLQFDPSSDGAIGIEVRDGGELNVLEGSTVESTSSTYYAFDARPNSTLTIRNSTLPQAGGFGDRFDQYPRIATGDATIDNTELGYLLIEDGTGATVTDSRVSERLLVRGADGVRIEGTELGDRAEVRNTVGVELVGNDIVDTSRDGGIVLENARDGVLRANSLVNADWIELRDGSSGNRIVNNVIRDRNDGAISVLGGSNYTTVRGNRIVSDTDGEFFDPVNGIDVQSSHVVVADNNVSWTGENGIRVGAQDDNVDFINVTLRNNIVSRSLDDGIRVSGRDITLRNNDVSGSEGHGILLQRAVGATLRDNTVAGSFHVKASDDFLEPPARDLSTDRSYYDHDIDASNTVNGGPLHYRTGETDTTIRNDGGMVWLVEATNVTVTGSGAVATALSEDVTVRDADASDGYYYGVFAAYSNRTTVRNVTATNNDFGVVVYGSSSDAPGDDGFNSSGNVVADTNVSNSTETGVWMGGVDDSVVRDTEARRTVGTRDIYTPSIRLGGYNLTVAGNNASSQSGTAIRVLGANNTIANNTVRNSREGGIMVDGWLDPDGGNNTITGNVLRDNGATNIRVRTDGTLVADNEVRGDDRGGIYVERNNITVRGNDVTGHSQEGILVEGYYAEVRDNVVTDNQQGIVDNRDDQDAPGRLPIVDNRIADNVGAGIETGAPVAIRRNNGTGNAVGIDLGFSADHILAGNNLTGTESSVRMDEVRNATLRNNTLGTGGLAIQYDSGRFPSTIAEFSHDIDTSNTYRGAPVHYLVGADGATVPADAGAVWLINSTNVTAHGGHRAVVGWSSNVTVRNVSVTGYGNGVRLFETDDGTLTNVSTVDVRGGPGIELLDGNDIHLRDVTIRNTTGAPGLRLARVSNGEFVNITAPETTTFGNGIELGFETNHNRFVDITSVGMSVDGAHNNTVTDFTGNSLEIAGSDNVFRNVTTGPVFDSSDLVFREATNNTVADSNVSSVQIQYQSNENTLTGSVVREEIIVEDYTEGNLIYDNRFDPFIRVELEGESQNRDNRWNVTKQPANGTNIVGGEYLGGNYWPNADSSDLETGYNGVDVDGDGLGDTRLPYNASGQFETGGDYHPLVPQESDEPVGTTVWETNVTVDVSADGTRTLEFTVPADRLSGRTGKFKLGSELTSSTGGVIATQDPAFYVVDGDTVVTLETDEQVYQPGETVELEASVQNTGDSTLDRTLSVTQDGTAIETRSFTLGPGESGRYSVTTDATGSFTAAASAGGVTVEERVAVSEPRVNATLVAPDVVGRAPFTAGVLLENTGAVPVTLDVGIADQSTEQVTLAPGDTELVERSLQIDADTTLEATLGGDLERTLRQSVELGERADVTVSPPAVSEPGTVRVPYTVENTGQLETAFDLTVDLDGQTVRREVYLTPGSDTAGTIQFDLGAGNYTLAYASPFGANETTVRVAERNRATIEVDAAEAVGPEGRLRANATVRNVGADDINGTLVANSTAFLESRAFNVTAGGSRTVPLVVDVPESASAGQHDLDVRAISEGSTVATDSTRFTVTEPRFEVVSGPTDRTVRGGETVSLNVTVENVGGDDGRRPVNVTVPGIHQAQPTVWLNPGERGNATVTFRVPDDLSTGRYDLIYGAGGERVRTDLIVEGLNVTATASLDEPVYDEGDTATLTMQVTNRQSAAADLFSRVQYNGYDRVQNYTLPGGETRTLTFRVPVTSGPDEKIFYSVYAESGRSLYINGIRAHRNRSADLTVSTGERVYDIGDTATVDLQAHADGVVSVSAPGLAWTERLSAGETRNLSFTVPPLRSGTYYVHYSFENRSYSYPFDVDGYHVRVFETELDEERPPAGGDVDLTLTVDSNRAVSTTVTTRILDEEDEVVSESTRPVDLPAGRDTVTVGGTLPDDASGVHTAIYRIDAAQSSPVQLVQGSEYFEVSGQPADGNEPPVAVVSYSPSRPFTGRTVTYDGSDSSDPDGTVSRYEWDLDGDGSFEVTGPVVTEAFDTAGERTVTLRVIDDRGATDTTTRTVRVRPLDRDGDDEDEDAEPTPTPTTSTPTPTADGTVEVADRTLVEDTTTPETVAVRVTLRNPDQVRREVTLNLTANNTTVGQRTFAVDAGAERTVTLRHAFAEAGRYVVGVNGVSVGTVAVGTGTEPTVSTGTATPTVPPTPTAATPSRTTGTDTATATPTATQTPTPSAAPTASPTRSGTATTADGPGLGPLAVLVALLLLVGAGRLRRRD